MDYILKLSKEEVKVLEEIFAYGTFEVMEKHFESCRMAPLANPTRQAVESLNKKIDALGDNISK